MKSTIQKQKEHQGTQKQQREQKRLAAGIGVVLILLFLIIAFFLAARSGGNVGQAISIGGEPFEDIVNLLEEEMVTFTALPDEAGREFTIRTGVDPYDETPQDYSLRIFRVDELNYGYSIAGEVEQDIIIAGEMIPIYLNDDLAADLEFSFRQGALSIKNLHFLPPDSARIRLQDADGNELPGIMRLRGQVLFTASLHAESDSAAPELSVNTGELSSRRQERNAANADFSFFPAEEGVTVLEITANVRGQRTKKAYTFLVGNEAYRLEQAAFPLMIQRLPEDISAIGDRSASFIVQFRDTEQLQPFSLPCRAAQRNMDELFENTAVQQVLTYAREETQVWTAGDVPDTFNQLEAFQGYYVKIEEGAPAAQREVTVECTIEAVSPAQEPPAEGSQLQSFAFEEGWTLFTLPGVVPKALASFTAAPYRIFSCAQNYVCEELDAAAALEPGKPYWVFAEERFSISMRRE